MYWKMAHKIVTLENIIKYDCMNLFLFIKKPHINLQEKRLEGYTQNVYRSPKSRFRETQNGITINAQLMGDREIEIW